MFARFFIERPIFAAVISIVIVLVGLVALATLPIAQYPEISPPTVEVRAVYPGANAVVLAETVAAPIEQEVNGVEGMIYMSSTSANDGTYVLTVTFELGTNLDMAQVLVQNRVSIAEPRLPEDVRRQGVTVKKKSTNIVLFVALSAPDKQYDSLYIHNYATLRVKDELARIDGVGDVAIFGANNYSMRVWVDPEKLKARDLATQDVVSAIAEQNVQVAAGQIGQPPVPPGQTFQYSINTLGRLNDVEQFQNIVVKTAEGTRITRLKDVARVELGAQGYDQYFQTNGQPAAGIAIYQLPGANALDVAADVRTTVERLKKNFPAGLVYSIPFDTTRFIDASIQQVYITLLEAILLVFLVLFLFLQDWRATVIPAVTIPVSLVGTFAVMAMLGFSINMITLFAMVLAIGIVVDDAIVVVENVWQHMETSGLSARDATIKAMSEISGAIVATTLVLIAVFVPTAFLPGITGQLYKQFALTIAVSTVFSSINALTLSPALSALILRPPNKERRNFVFRTFNTVFARGQKSYEGVVGGVTRRTLLMMVLFAVIALGSGWGFVNLPTGFLPIEDQGYIIAGAQLPDAASQERTRAVVEQVNQTLSQTPGVASWLSIGGLSILDSTVASNSAAFYIVFDDWSERTRFELSARGIVGRIRKAFASIQEAQLFVFVPPPIQGLGVSGGFEMKVQDRGGVGHQQLQVAVQRMAQDGRAQSSLATAFSNFRAGVPQLFVNVDRTKAKSLDLPLDSVFGTLQTYLGSSYVNDFNKFGRTYQVRVQAKPAFRIRKDDIRRLEARNRKGEMVPLGTLVKVSDTLGPQVINRYNLYPAASLNGEPAPGFSSGEALSLVEEMATRLLPNSMGYEWTGVSFQEKQVGGEAVVIFALSILLVFLVLSAQYESWTSPLAVILAVPLALLGTVVVVGSLGMDNNVYTQIGIVLLIGLATKNAILIVEFARDLHAQGQSIVDAAVNAARLRFRPILMTALTFIFGVIPLVVARGAGAASQRAVGTAVFGGMVAATFFSLVFVPVFYVVCQRLSEIRGTKETRANTVTGETGSGPS